MIELNYISLGFIAVFLLQGVSALWLDRINLRHMRRFGSTVPEAFAGYVDPEKLGKMTDYAADNSFARSIQRIVMDAVLLVLIVSGVLAVLEESWLLPRLHPIWVGVIFFALLTLFFSALALPFDWYQTFVIEEKYGFNRSTVKLWIADHIKGLLLSLVILVGLSAAILWVIHRFPDWWWLGGFAIVSVVQLCITVLYPILIAPIFNRFEPLEDHLLARRVEHLIEDVGMRSGGIFQMDAGRRSTHSNAYFSGLGKTKRVVLFDTLLETHSHDEILAVLAHELGHFKLRHILKEYLIFQVGLLAGFYLAYLMMGWDEFGATFGFSSAQPYGRLLLIGILFASLGFWLRPLIMILSRWFERQADAFAVHLLGTASPLITALKNIASHNLSNLTPHPLYVLFSYSHPPLLDRIRFLEEEGAAVVPPADIESSKAANM